MSASGTQRTHRHEELVGASFAGADLRDVIFEHVDLIGADFSGARLDGAVLRHCDLSSAQLAGASLGGASLGVCELRGANLAGADLRRASLTMCDLQEAKLTRCALDGGAFVSCRFDGADLTGASFLKANTLYSVFDRAHLAEARQFAWSREIVVELLRREAKGVEEAKYVGAIALHQDWCYEEWREIVADAPQARERALAIMSAWPDSGFARAFSDDAEPKGRPVSGL